MSGAFREDPTGRHSSVGRLDCTSDQDMTMNPTRTIITAAILAMGAAAPAGPAVYS